LKLHLGHPFPDGFRPIPIMLYTTIALPCWIYVGHFYNRWFDMSKSISKPSRIDF
jgi:fucose permease